MAAEFSGPALRERRRATGMSAEQLAVRIGRGSRAVYRWEREETVPDAADLASMASALECGVDGFFVEPVHAPKACQPQDPKAADQQPDPEAA